MRLHRLSHIRRKWVRAPCLLSGRALLVDGHAPHTETLSVGPGTNLKTCGVAQAGLPLPAPESRTFHRRPKTQQPEQNASPNPTTEHPHRRPSNPSFPRSRESIPPEQPHPTPQLNPAPFRYSLPSPQYQTRGKRLRHGAGASLCFFLPLSLKGPKRACPESLEGERGIKGVRVPSPSLKQSKPCLKSQNNQTPAPLPCPLPHKKSSEISLGVIQSNQLRVQSTFNQNSTPAANDSRRLTVPSQRDNLPAGSLRNASRPEVQP